MTITIHKNRDGASLEMMADGTAIICGVAAREIINPSRVIALLPPMPDIKLTPDKIYSVYTGLVIDRRIGAPADLRPVFAVFRESGMRIERIDLDGNSPAGGELVVYVSVIAPIQLSRTAALFETSRFAGSVVAFESMRMTVDGFAPAATRSVTDSSVKKTAAGAAPREPSDEEKRKRFAAMLDDVPPATTSPAPATSPGSAQVFREDGTLVKPAIIRPMTENG